MHQKEEDIIKIASLTKKERKVSLELLRSRGDFYHNIKVLQTGGELKVFRRPLESERVSASSYTPCTSCLGFFLKSELWRHNQNCVANPDTTRKGRKLIHESSILLHGGCGAKNQSLWNNVISTMKNDDITNIVKKDDLILSFGSFLFANS